MAVHTSVRRSFLLLTLVVTLFGCAAPATQRVNISDAATKREADLQMELAVSDMVKEQERISRINRDIATKASQLCGEHVGPSTGMFAMKKPKGDMGTVLERKYGITSQQTVLFVLPNTPAEKGGLRARDIITSVNGTSTDDEDALKTSFEKAQPEAPIVYSVMRGGERISLTVMPERACSYPISLNPSQVINAYADGKRIVIARGMVNFAKDDNELAVVISHELAHNLMKHIEEKKQNAGAGLLADLAVVLLSRGQVTNTNFASAGANAYSQEFEAEADYVGLYIMASAGLNIADAPKFWRRMASAHPGNIKTNHAASHPSTAYRMVALEETVTEIGEKRSRGQPLLPNMKDGKYSPPTK